MRTTAIAFFSIAALLSAWLTPNNLPLVTVLFISVPRAIALLVALLLWLASGRLDAWGSSRLAPALITMAGVAALSFGCFLIQTARDDGLPAPVPMLYRVALALLPFGLIAGAIVPSRTLFLIVTVVAPVTGIVVVSTWDQLHAKYIDSLPETKLRREFQEAAARRKAALEQLPQTAGLDQLVEYVKPAELDEIRNPAMARIESAPDWIAQLSAMLDGDHRLNALYILTRHLDRLPAPVLERCWSTAGSVARDQLKRLKEGSAPTETDQIMLDESVKDMGFQGAPMRERHWKEIAEVREFLEAANPKGNNVFLDSWVRTSQFERVPESAGIEPLLEFAGPSESEDIRKGALDRIGKVPDSTAKLAKFLDGPHRLDALVVLALRVDHLPEDLRERCWQAAGLTAKEMAAAIQQRNPPTPVEARKLRTLVTSIWGKLGPVQDGRLTDLATVREVVRAVGGDYDKAEFAWADGVLDAAKPAGGPRK